MHLFRFIKYLFPFFLLCSCLVAQEEKIVILKNIPYVENGGERRQLDLYLPQDYKKLEKPLPVILVIHGGGWRHGTKDSPKFADWAYFFAENEFAAASINYRLYPEHRMPQQIIDCKSAIRWLRANAEKYHFDSKHFGALGSSAGGHLSALLGTTGLTREFDLGENLDQSSAIQAAVDFCGPADFLEFHAVRPEFVKRLFGNLDEENRSLAKKMSPLHNVTAQSTPMLIAHAADDRIVPVEQSRELDKALQVACVESELIELAKGGHGVTVFTNPKMRKRVKSFFEKLKP